MYLECILNRFTPSVILPHPSPPTEAVFIEHLMGDYVLVSKGTTGDTEEQHSESLELGSCSPGCYTGHGSGGDPAVI
jgi:hypothetical protein